jgi:hypothetical protein
MLIGKIIIMLLAIAPDLDNFFTKTFVVDA